MFAGSLYPGLTSTTIFLAQAAATTDRASIADRSGGVWVAMASASTNFRNQSASTSVGNVGKSNWWKGIGGTQFVFGLVLSGAPAHGSDCSSSSFTGRL